MHPKSPSFSPDEPVFISRPCEEYLYDPRLANEHGAMTLSVASAVPFNKNDDTIHRFKTTYGQWILMFQNDLSTQLLPMGGLSESLKDKLNTSLMHLVPISYYCLPESACIIVVSRDMDKKHHVTRYFQMGADWVLSYDARSVSADEAFAALMLSLK
jgi:hypothetical protein